MKAPGTAPPGREEAAPAGREEAAPPGSRTAAPRAWDAWVESTSSRLKDEQRWRTLADLDGTGVVGTLADGTRVVSFASNDYLGLSQHPAVKEAAAAALDRWGAGAGASRLVTGSRPVHSLLEEELASWKHTGRALVFATGYAANLGVLTALGGPGTTILSDQLNHASIIDGCRLSRSDVVVYPHLDLDGVEDGLRAATRAGRRALVASESVFSMDGNTAPVGRLAELCATYGALLVLDEAHGVLDEHWAGGSPHFVLRVGTLSKALGSVGGFVAGPDALIALVVNLARSFVYSTAPTPGSAASALAALRVLRSDEGRSLLDALRANVALLKPGHRSPIVPVVAGSEEAALALSAELLGHGILVPAIRPPTVPPGTSRLRISLSAAHSPEQVAGLVRILRELGVAPS